MEAGTAKASAASSSFAAKHISKQITEDIIPVTALKMEFMICSISGAEGSRPVCSAGTVSEAAEPAKTTGTCSGALSVTCRLIAIDALAAGDPERVGTTVQICDSGISPGSGVSNRRKELSRRTLGIPVIAIGVPTVVDYPRGNDPEPILLS